MSEPTTRSPAMSAQDIERIVKLLENGQGARVTVQDPRVSKAAYWALGLIGTVGVGFVGSLSVSVTKLGADLRENTAELRGYNKRFDDFRADYAIDKSEIKTRISSLEQERRK